MRRESKSIGEEYLQEEEGKTKEDRKEVVMKKPLTERERGIEPLFMCTDFGVSP